MSADYLHVVDGYDDVPDEILFAGSPDDGHRDDGDNPAPATSDPDEAPSKKSAATRLVELAHSIYDLHADTDGTPYAVEIDGPNVALPFRNGRRGLRAQLSAAYLANEGKVAPAAALADALTALEGEAALADPVACGLRIAAHDDGIVVDLGTPDGTAVEITPGRWSVRRASPVTFRRTALSGALPVPVDGGDLELLRDLVNVTDESWPHLVGWLVAAFLPTIPHPVLSLHGEMGTGKSTAAATLVSLVDPSPAPLRTSPRDVDSWAIAAAGSWVVGLDNISGIAPWLSDALCRAVTGDGMVRRQLYTDGDLVVLNFRRCVILTAIDAGAMRGDLADRLVRVGLERIPQDRRRTDAEVAAQLDQHRPAILGALLDVVAAVLEVLPTVELATLPRMADYARVLAAVDQVTGLDCLARYLALGSELMADVVDDDPVATAVRALTQRKGGRWSGTASDMFDAITPERPPKGWPANPRTLSAVVKAASTALRSVGIEITTERTSKARTITCEMVGTASSSSSHRHALGPDQHQHRTPARDGGTRPDDDGDDDAQPGDHRPPPIVTPEAAGQPTDPTADDDGDGADRAISHVVDTDPWEADYADLFACTPEGEDW